LARRYKEVFVFVLGKTPQVITETIYCLLKKEPPILPDVIHVFTTTEGERCLKENLIEKRRLNEVFEDYGFTAFPLENLHLHLFRDSNGIPLDDIKTSEDNQAVARQIIEFFREITKDPDVRLHCSLAGGRKTMGFYLGSALQLFGRRWDKLYHVLVSPEFESLEEFYYKPRERRFLEVNGRLLSTADAEIYLAELPFITLREKISHKGEDFEGLINDSQKDIDLAIFQKEIEACRKDLSLRIGKLKIGLSPVMWVFYVFFLQRKLEACTRPDFNFCDRCYDCFIGISYFCSKEALQFVEKELRGIYGPLSGRYEAFVRYWSPKGGFHPEVIRQNISKLNKTLRLLLADEAGLYVISSVGKRGLKRYGVRVDRSKIKILT